MNIELNTKPVYININETNHLSLFCEQLFSYFLTYLPRHNHELVIICIGTDRATGDSLGPLVGYKLQDLPYARIIPKL